MHRIRVELEPEVATVKAEGELDAYAVPDLDAGFERVSASRRVLADLEAVSFMDSTALGLVVKATRELGERGADVRILLPRGTARRIFEITTLDRVLPLSPSREEALAALTSNGDAPAGG